MRSSLVLLNTSRTETLQLPAHARRGYEHGYFNSSTTYLYECRCVSSCLTSGGSVSRSTGKGRVGCRSGSADVWIAWRSAWSSCRTVYRWSCVPGCARRDADSDSRRDQTSCDIRHKRTDAGQNVCDVREPQVHVGYWTTSCTLYIQKNPIRLHPPTNSWTYQGHHVYPGRTLDLHMDDIWYVTAG